ncbi:hypothetical protein [Pseudomonas sp. 58(2021)]|uniref:hypothetical protein n=1 Tax=Pseudomonas sp. 58(2021) TaxID=2813330 RepID=UPI001A9CE3F5|nr:hypothetical protein [Pseudomonas sp. 58(2021)]
MAKTQKILITGLQPMHGDMHALKKAVEEYFGLPVIEMAYGAEKKSAAAYFDVDEVIGRQPLLHDVVVTQIPFSKR